MGKGRTRTAGRGKGKDKVKRKGKARGMVDISAKPVVTREATAEGYIMLTPRALDAIRKGRVEKGHVLEVARVSAINGVKATPAIIPHCHPIPVEGVEVDISVLMDRVKVTCTVKASYRTGVEMEAVTGVMTALLTVWDMVKYLEKDGGGQYPTTVITDVRVLEKRKGR